MSRWLCLGLLKQNKIFSLKDEYIYIYIYIYKSKNIEEDICPEIKEEKKGGGLEAQSHDELLL